MGACGWRIAARGELLRSMFSVAPLHLFASPFVSLVCVCVISFSV